MLFRATRGNCFFHFMEVEQPLVDPKSGALVRKAAFVVFFKGLTIEQKIRRVAKAFGAATYDVGELALGDAAAVRRAMRENAHELQDARLVLLKNREERVRACTRLAMRLEDWAWLVACEKATHATLNLFAADVSGILSAEGWISTRAIGRARGARAAHASRHASMPSLLEPRRGRPTPPTHFQTNSFTLAFQEFVNTYGVPRTRRRTPRSSRPRPSPSSSASCTACRPRHVLTRRGSLPCRRRATRTRARAAARPRSARRAGTTR